MAQQNSTHTDRGRESEFSWENGEGGKGRSPQLLHIHLETSLLSFKLSLHLHDDLKNKQSVDELISQHSV